MDELTKAIGDIALGLKDKMDDHIRAAGEADQDLGFALTMFGSGASGSQWGTITKNAKNPKSAQVLSELTANVAGEAYIKGIVFGIKLAAEYGFRFVETPEGIKLEPQIVTKNEGMMH